MFVSVFDVCGLFVRVNRLLGVLIFCLICCVFVYRILVSIRGLLGSTGRVDVTFMLLNLFLLVLRLYYTFCFPSSIGASVSFEILFILFIVCVILSISGKACRTPGLAVRKLVLLYGC